MISGPGGTCQEEPEPRLSLSLGGSPWGQKCATQRAGDLAAPCMCWGGKGLFRDIWKSSGKGTLEGLGNGSFHCMRVRRGEISSRSRGTGASRGLGREGSNSNDWGSNFLQWAWLQGIQTQQLPSRCSGR